MNPRLDRAFLDRLCEVCGFDPPREPLHRPVQIIRHAGFAPFGDCNWVMRKTV